MFRILKFSAKFWKNDWLKNFRVRDKRNIKFQDFALNLKVRNIKIFNVKEF